MMAPSGARSQSQSQSFEPTDASGEDINIKPSAYSNTQLSRKAEETACATRNTINQFHTSGKDNNKYYT